MPIHSKINLAVSKIYAGKWFKEWISKKKGKKGQNQFSYFLKKQMEITERFKNDYKIMLFGICFCKVVEFLLSKKFNEPIHTLFDKSKNEYYSNFPKLNGIYQSKLIQSDDGDIISPSTKIVLASISDVEIFKNRLTEVPNYKITWKTKRNTYVIHGSVIEIIQKLKINGLCGNKSKIDDAVNHIINEIENKFPIPINSEIQINGFYIDESKHLISNPERQEPSSLEKLKAVLIILDEFVTEWYKFNQINVSTCLKWSIIAPFSFAKKQLHDLNESVELNPYLLAQGSGGIGKTTIMRAGLLLFIDDTSPFDISADSVKYEARFAHNIKHSTYPLLVNEPLGFFQKEEMRETLKDIYEKPTNRGKYHSGLYINQLAGSNIAFTTNKPLSTRLTGAELRRFSIVHFSFKDKEFIKEKQKDFTKWKPNMKQLTDLGDYIYDIVKKDYIRLFNMFWQEASEEILKRLYETANMKVPEWVYFRTKEEIEDLKLEYNHDIINLIHKYTGEVILKNRLNIESKTTTFGRLELITQKNLNSDVFLTQDKQGNLDLIITREFTEYLMKHNLEFGNLSDLAVILEGEHKVVDCKKRKFNQRAVRVSLKKLGIDAESEAEIEKSEDGVSEVIYNTLQPFLKEKTIESEDIQKITNDLLEFCKEGKTKDQIMIEFPILSDCFDEIMKIHFQNGVIYIPYENGQETIYKTT